MALYRCGGAPLPNLKGTPDAKYLNNTAGTSGTVDIAVTKKPRYIIATIWTRTGTSYPGNLMIIDTTTMTGYRMGYSGSSTTDGALNSSQIASYFPTISASKVTYNMATWGLNHRVYIALYY